LEIKVKTRRGGLLSMMRGVWQTRRKGGVIMGTIRSTVRVGQKIPKEILKLAKEQVREARKAPPVYDPDCPPSTPEALAEFAAMARELRKNRRNPAPVVALRLMPDVL
jgi:hypothetical protein